MTKQFNKSEKKALIKLIVLIVVCTILTLLRTSHLSMLINTLDCYASDSEYYDIYSDVDEDIIAGEVVDYETYINKLTEISGSYGETVYRDSMFNDEDSNYLVITGKSTSADCYLNLVSYKNGINKLIVYVDEGELGSSGGGCLRVVPINMPVGTEIEVETYDMNSFNKVSVAESEVLLAKYVISFIPKSSSSGHGYANVSGYK
jgi:hypothetical protein